MTYLKENISFFASILGIISTIINAVIGYTFDKFSFGVSLFVIVLLICVLILDQQVKKAERKFQVLYSLAQMKRVHSLNFILYFEALQRKNTQEKLRNPYIADSIFEFHITNSSDKDIVNVEYNHTFYVVRHNSSFDTFLLHTAGELDRESVCCTYENKKLDDATVPDTTSGVNNKNNQRISHYKFQIKKETNQPSRLRIILSFYLKKIKPDFFNIPSKELTIHYRNTKDHFMKDDEVFLIFPKNYGTLFTGKVTFRVQYDVIQKPCSIKLQRFFCNRKAGKIDEKPLYFKEQDQKYELILDSLDMNSIYFIVINRME